MNRNERDDRHRDEHGHFIKGNKASPGGWAQKAVAVRRAIMRAVKPQDFADAMRVLCDIWRDPDNRPLDRIKAIEVMRDTAMGRPQSTVLDTETSGRIIRMVLQQTTAAVEITDQAPPSQPLPIVAERVAESVK